MKKKELKNKIKELKDFSSETVEVNEELTLKLKNKNKEIEALQDKVNQVNKLRAASITLNDRLTGQNVELKQLNEILERNNISLKTDNETILSAMNASNEDHSIALLAAQEKESELFDRIYKLENERNILSSTVSDLIQGKNINSLLGEIINKLDQLVNVVE